MRAILFAVLLSCACPALAIEDTPENRYKQIERYMEVVPPREMLNDITKNLSRNYPPNQRYQFRTILMSHVNIDTLVKAMNESMAKHFTAAEIKALADFYSTDAGQSAMKKMGVYMADVMPVVQAEVARAFKKFQEQEERAHGGPVLNRPKSP